MSAFVVSDRHIDCMVRVALSGPSEVSDFRGAPQWYGVNYAKRDASFDRANEIGAALVLENLKSVGHRYNEPFAVPAYFYNSLAKRLTAVEALKAIACYEYQSCEHPGWEESAACKFCTDLKNALHHCLPGWDEAAWGID